LGFNILKIMDSCKGKQLIIKKDFWIHEKLNLDTWISYCFTADLLYIWHTQFCEFTIRFLVLTIHDLIIFDMWSFGT